jgi:hypothetical protein
MSLSILSPVKRGFGEIAADCLDSKTLLQRACRGHTRNGMAQELEGKVEAIVAGNIKSIFKMAQDSDIDFAIARRKAD